MSLRYALLGFLNLGPMTGYDLKKQLDRSTQSFWHAGLNQIYPTLKHMQDEGWITSTVEEQEGRPNRVQYSIAETGRQELLEWLARPLEDLPRGRHPDLLQLFFAGYLDNEAALELLRQQRSLHQQRLAERRQTKDVIASVVEDHPHLARPAAFWELVRDLGERNESMYLDWLDDAIEVVGGLR